MWKVLLLKEERLTSQEGGCHVCVVGEKKKRDKILWTLVRQIRREWGLYNQMVTQANWNGKSFQARHLLIHYILNFKKNMKCVCKLSFKNPNHWIQLNTRSMYAGPCGKWCVPSSITGSLKVIRLCLPGNCIVNKTFQFHKQYTFCLKIFLRTALRPNQSPFSCHFSGTVWKCPSDTWKRQSYLARWKLWRKVAFHYQMISWKKWIQLMKNGSCLGYLHFYYCL